MSADTGFFLPHFELVHSETVPNGTPSVPDQSAKPHTTSRYDHVVVIPSPTQQPALFDEAELKPPAPTSYWKSPGEGGHVYPNTTLPVSTPRPSGRITLTEGIQATMKQDPLFSRDEVATNGQFPPPIRYRSEYRREVGETDVTASSSSTEQPRLQASSHSEKVLIIGGVPAASKFSSDTIKDAQPVQETAATGKVTKGTVVTFLREKLLPPRGRKARSR